MDAKLPDGQKAGLHGRLVCKGKMEDSAAGLLLNKIARAALDLSKAAWKSRCTSVNEAETNAQVRNRWGEAVMIVARDNGMSFPQLKPCEK